MNPKGAIFIMVIGAIVGFGAGGVGKADLKTKLRAAQNEHALADSLKVVYQDEAITLHERLAVVQDNAAQLGAIVEREVPAMARRIHELEGTELSLVLATATIDSLKVTNLGATIDTVVITDTGIERTVGYSFSQPGISVEVFIRGIMDTTSTPTADITAAIEPLDIAVGIFELPTGQVGVDVQLPNWASLGNLATNIDLPEPGWWERNDFKIGMAIGGAIIYGLVKAIR